MGLLDLGTRKWWRAVGRRVDLAGPERWLDAPMSASTRVTDGWLQAEAARHGGTLTREDPQAGLLSSMSALDGPVQCFGVSGWSGAGTSPSDKNNPDKLRDNLMPYALAGHLHEREVARLLEHVADDVGVLTFEGLRPPARRAARIEEC